MSFLNLEEFENNRSTLKKLIEGKKTSLKTDFSNLTEEKILQNLDIKNIGEIENVLKIKKEEIEILKKIF